jgi:hypothetical protein
LEPNQSAFDCSNQEIAMNNPCRLALLVIAISVAGSVFANVSEESLRAADAEQMRIIVEGDAQAQAAFMHDNYILNGPAGRVLRKPILVEMLAQGRMASDRFERVIEGTAITGSIGVVMGRETVQPGAGSELSARFGAKVLHRRFTNVFIFENGRWYFLARQATVAAAPAE